MIDSLRKLAARIDHEWTSAGRRVGALPDIAARLLEEAQPHRGFDLRSLAGWTLSRRTFPQACNPFGPLGPPAFTIWSRGELFANVYAYTSPEVVIHDHDFAGAFVNLSGTTLHATYEFDSAERVAPPVHVGALDVKEVEVVRQGDVRRIDPGRRFIHQVWHLDQPTVVLVIRTGPLPSRARRQFQYMRAGLAAEVFRNDAMLPAATERFRYARKMTECLRLERGGGIDYLRTLVENERPWDAVWHLIENWRYLRAAGAIEDLIRHGAKHQGGWFAGLEAAASEVDLFYSIRWPGVRTVEDRIALALLLTFDGWRPMREWLERLLPGVAPEARMADSLTRLGDAGAIPLQLGAQGAAMLACMLNSNGDRDAWRRQVREAFSIGSRGEWSVANAMERTLRGHRLLEPLFLNLS